jgi:hypothetical protein
VTGPGRAEYAAWLRAERERRGWNRPQMARRIIQAAHIKGDRSVPGLDSMLHNLYRWERGLDGVSERYRLLLQAIFGLPPPAALVNGTAHATLAPGNGIRPASALTVTITIALPPGTTADITTTGLQPAPAADVRDGHPVTH